MPDPIAASQTIEALCAVIDSPRNGEEADTGETATVASLFRELMGQLELDAGSLALRLGFDKQTVQRWLNGTIPRANVKPRLRALMPTAIEETAHAAPAETPLSRRRAPTILTSEKYADREKYASDIWIFKWNRRFKTTEDPFVLAAVENIIKRTSESADNSVDAPMFHYVYPSTKVLQEISELSRKSEGNENALGEVRDLEVGRIFDSDHSAMNSYIDAKDYFEDKHTHKGILDKCVMPHPIDNLSEVLHLGLCRFDAGTILIVYNQKGVKKYRRPIDLFIETDISLSNFDQDDEYENEEYDIVRTFYIELPRETAARLRQRWNPILKRLSKP